MPETSAVDLGMLLPMWSALPFAGMLLSIATLPLLAPGFWHHHYSKVSAAWALAFALPFLLRFGGAAWHELLHVALVDYIPFVILIASLFTIGGGIHVSGIPARLAGRQRAHHDRGGLPRLAGSEPPARPW